MEVYHIRYAVWSAALFLAAACGGSTQVQTIANPDEPTEAQLFDFGQADLRASSAFDIVSSSPVRIDASSRWDFLFQIKKDGTAQLRPRGVIVEGVSTAGLVKATVVFDAIASAPLAGYQTQRATTIEVGDVLLMRSERDPSIQLRCLRFGKMEVLDIDKQEGTIIFKHLINPNCENRNLIAGEAIPIDEQS